MALLKVPFFIAYALADAFGAATTSARPAAEIEPANLNVSRVLLDAVILERQVLSRNSWLNTAGRVISSCRSLEGFDEMISRD